jgi:hypothetical protein
MPERSPSFFRCVFTWGTHVYFLTVEVLAVPKNMKLLAIPLFELYDNAAR